MKESNLATPSAHEDKEGEIDSAQIEAANDDQKEIDEGEGDESYEGDERDEGDAEINKEVEQNITNMIDEVLHEGDEGDERDQDDINSNNEEDYKNDDGFIAQKLNNIKMKSSDLEAIAINYIPDAPVKDSEIKNNDALDEGEGDESDEGDKRDKDDIHGVSNSGEDYKNDGIVTITTSEEAEGMMLKDENIVKEIISGLEAVAIKEAPRSADDSVVTLDQNHMPSEALGLLSTADLQFLPESPKKQLDCEIEDKNQKIVESSEILDDDKDEVDLVEVSTASKEQLALVTLKNNKSFLAAHSNLIIKAFGVASMGVICQNAVHLTDLCARSGLILSSLPHLKELLVASNLKDNRNLLPTLTCLMNTVVAISGPISPLIAIPVVIINIGCHYYTKKENEMAMQM